MEYEKKSNVTGESLYFPVILPSTLSGVFFIRTLVPI